MNKDTRIKFNALAVGVAMAYGYTAADAGQQFAATPSVAQALQDKIVEQSDFLGRINVIGVDELKGEKILGSANSTVTKRTDTDTNDRQTSDVLGLDTNGYELFKTESDVHIKYHTMDAWAKFPDLADRYQGYVRQKMAMDRILIGFYGTSAAAETDPGTNTLLQDVNKGWLQHVRDNAPGQIVAEIVNASGRIRIGSGAGADFPNLDAAVNDLMGVLGDAHQESGDLVVLVGRELISDEKARLYAAQGSTPTEKSKIEDQQVIGTYGGLPAYKVAKLPPRAVIITSFDNLSIYYQNDSWRRKIEDNPKRDRVEEYNSRNEGYVVEDYEKFAAFEFANVELWDGAAWS